MASKSVFNGVGMSDCDGWNITCGRCHFIDSFDVFTSTPVNGALPKHHYQCPNCKQGWSIKNEGEPVVFDDGFVMPAKRKIYSEIERL